MKIKKVRANAIIPTYGSATAAGADLYACLEADAVIEPGKTVFIIDQTKCIKCGMCVASCKFDAIIKE